MNKTSTYRTIIFLFAMLIGSALFYLLQNLVNSGKLGFLAGQTATVTVVGSAQKTITNQVAEFTAGIEVIAEEKTEATDQAAETMNQLLTRINSLGIDPQDIQTSQVSVYQEDEFIDQPLMETELMMIYPPRPTQKGNWRADINTIITLRSEDAEELKNKSESLLAILNESGANYIYGPSFRLDNQSIDEAELINEAVSDARKKAEAIASSNKQRVRKVLEVVEDQVGPQPFYRDQFAVTSAGDDWTSTSLEPGSSMLSKTVTVTFQLR
jgi:hypothetical protein